MANMNSELWDIGCTPEGFKALKSDERFLGLLTLARFVNALRFCQQPVIAARKVDSPSASRQTINYFLFASSVLYEGFLLVERLGKHFHNLDSFKNGFGILLRDRSVTALRRSVLQRMRNKFVFHFNGDVAKDALTNFELPNYRFASSLGKASGEMYFGLADEAVMNYLLQPEPTESDDVSKQRLQKLIQDVTELMGRFTDAAEKLMAEVLSSMGWTARIRDKQ